VDARAQRQYTVVQPRIMTVEPFPRRGNGSSHTRRHHSMPLDRARTLEAMHERIDELRRHL